MIKTLKELNDELNAIWAEYDAVCTDRDHTGRLKNPRKAKEIQNKLYSKAREVKNAESK